MRSRVIARGLTPSTPHFISCRGKSIVFILRLAAVDGFCLWVLAVGGTGVLAFGGFVEIIQFQIGRFRPAVALTTNAPLGVGAAGETKTGRP